MADIIIRVRRVMASVSSRRYLIYRYRGQNINDVLEMTVNRAIEFFGEGLNFSCQEDSKASGNTLQDVGLGYIKLGQSSSTLSGGENQRDKLAYYLAQGGSPEPAMFIYSTNRLLGCI